MGDRLAAKETVKIWWRLQKKKMVRCATIPNTFTATIQWCHVRCRQLVLLPASGRKTFICSFKQRSRSSLHTAHLLKNQFTVVFLQKNILKGWSNYPGWSWCGQRMWKCCVFFFVLFLLCVCFQWSLVCRFTHLPTCGICFLFCSHFNFEGGFLDCTSYQWALGL